MEVSDTVFIRGKLVFPCEDIILTQLLYTCVLKLCVGEHVYKMGDINIELNQKLVISE